MTPEPLGPRLQRWSHRAAFAALALLALAAVLAPWLTSYDPTAVNLDAMHCPPGRLHWFGTDTEGRDVFARVLYGARLSLGIGAGATLLSMAAGLCVGLAAGYWAGTPTDSALNMLIDINLAFPGLLLAIAISVVLPPGAGAVFIALAASGWGTFARLIRGQVLVLRELPYVTASVAVGSPGWRVICRHIVPGCLPTLAVAGGLKMGTFILGEAGLSFLGIGVPPPAPTWGGMVSLGREFLTQAPWMALFPGLAIALTVLCANLAGEALQAALPGTRSGSASSL